jgi:hypothetical protein
VYSKLSSSLRSLLDVLSLSIKLDKTQDLLPLKEGYATPANLHEWLNLDATGFQLNVPLSLKVDIEDSHLVNFALSIAGKVEVDLVAQLQSFEKKVHKEDTLWSKEWHGLTFPVMGVVSFTLDPKTSMVVTLDADAAFATEPLGIKVTGDMQATFGRSKDQPDWSVQFSNSLQHTLLKGGVNDGHATATFTIAPQMSMDVDIGVLLGPKDTAKLGGAVLKVPGHVTLGGKLDDGKVCVDGDFAVEVDATAHCGLTLVGQQIMKEHTWAGPPLWSKKAKASWCSKKAAMPSWSSVTEAEQYVAKMAKYLERLETMANVQGGFKVTGILPNL